MSACVAQRVSVCVCVAPWREKEWNEIVWGREREKQLQLTSVRSESSSWQECSCRKINFLWKHQLFCLTRLKTPSKIGAKSSKIKRQYLRLTWASFSKLCFRASSCFSLLSLRLLTLWINKQWRKFDWQQQQRMKRPRLNLSKEPQRLICRQWILIFQAPVFWPQKIVSIFYPPSFRTRPDFQQQPDLHNGITQVRSRL